MCCIRFRLAARLCPVEAGTLLCVPASIIRWRGERFSFRRLERKGTANAQVQAYPRAVSRCQNGRFRMPVPRGRLAIAVFCIEVGTMTNEMRHDICRFRSCARIGQHDGSLAITILRPKVCPFCREAASPCRSLGMHCLFSRYNQRSLAILTLCLNIGAFSQ